VSSLVVAQIITLPTVYNPL